MAKKTTDAVSVPRRRSTSAPRRGPAAAKEAAAGSREPTFEEIAEAAYHRYLKRGGRQGMDFEDWLEAERDLRSGKKTPNSP
jgi:hypothetical protein